MTSERRKKSEMVIDSIKVLVHNFDVLAMHVVSIVYPLYASIRAVAYLLDSVFYDHNV